MTNEQLVILIQNKVDTASNMAQLYEQTRSFIHTVAWKYRGYAELEDLEQEGFIGLCDAVDGYDPAAGFLFLTYARHWIRQRIVRYIQNNGTIRLPVHEWELLTKYKKLENAFMSQAGRKPSEVEIRHYLKLTAAQVLQLKRTIRIEHTGSLDSVLTDEDDITLGETVAGPDDVEGAVLDMVEADQMRAAVWKEVDGLPDNMPKIVRARYQRGETLRQIGAGMGVSMERVALRELRKSHRSRNLLPFLPDTVGSLAYSGNTAAFNRTWSSSTELAAMKL